MRKIYKRLLTLVDAFAEGSQTAFAKRAGLNQSTFWGYLSEHGQSKIKLNTLERIQAVYPEVNKNWLYFGEGEMLLAQSPPKPAAPPVRPDLLAKAVAMLEDALDSVDGRLAPDLKGEAIAEIYAILLEDESGVEKPMRVLKLVLGNLGKAG